VVDRQFSDPELAALYDVLSAGRADFAFYLPLVMSAPAVLDVGCGTGELLHQARQKEHPGRLVGLDPGAGMIEQARTRTDIEWVLADLGDAAWDQEFDLAVMTGHAFQVLLTDDEIGAGLAVIHRALAPAGRFAFETRNPAAQAWLGWTPDTVREVADADGTVTRMWHEVDETAAGELVSFTTTFERQGWNGSRQSTSTLRFLDADVLDAFLAGAGLAIEARYGDWDRSPFVADSPEIITIARRI